MTRREIYDRQNVDLERRVSETMGAEERRRVLRAAETPMPESLEWEHVEARIRRAVLIERERCAKIAEAFPDNLMAKHIAQKVRMAV